MTSDQLRAARILLRLDQRELARIALVGVSTVRRFEGGEEIGALQRDAMRRAIEEAGAILLAAGQDVGGRVIDAGVALRRRSELPEETRRRLSDADWGRRKRQPDATGDQRLNETGAAEPGSPAPRTPEST